MPWSDPAVKVSTTPSHMSRAIWNTPIPSGAAPKSYPKGLAEAVQELDVGDGVTPRLVCCMWRGRVLGAGLPRRTCPSMLNRRKMGWVLSMWADRSSSESIVGRLGDVLLEKL